MPHLDSEREHVFDIRRFTDRKTVDEILAPPVKGIPNLEHVIAGLRDFKIHNGVRIESEIVAICDLLSR